MNTVKGVVVVALLILSGCGSMTSGQKVANTEKDSEIAQESEKTTGENIVLSDKEWKEKLTTEEYRILRQKGTERAFTGIFDEHFEPGVYVCAGCGNKLFESTTKYNSGCGWPAFNDVPEDAIRTENDNNLGMMRTEVLCARCDGHLGHVFRDGPPPTGLRYCINSVSLKFIPKAEWDARKK